MGDSQWILQRRERYYKIVKSIARKEEGEFTVKSIRGKVRRSLYSSERWGFSSNRVTGAVNRLVREGFLLVSGTEQRGDGRFPVNVYVWVNSSTENQGTEPQS